MKTQVVLTQWINFAFVFDAMPQATRSRGGEHLISIFKELNARARSIPRREAPELCIILDPLYQQRAQGKPGADYTHGSRATKSTGVGRRFNRKHPAFPAR
jgi:hypothetical protein